MLYNTCVFLVLLAHGFSVRRIRPARCWSFDVAHMDVVCFVSLTCGPWMSALQFDFFGSRARFCCLRPLLFHFVSASSSDSKRRAALVDRRFMLSSFPSHSPGDPVPDLPLLCLLRLPGSLPPRVEHWLRWRWRCSVRGAACAGKILSSSRARGLLLHLLAQSTGVETRQLPVSPLRGS